MNLLLSILKIFSSKSTKPSATRPPNGNCRPYDGYDIAPNKINLPAAFSHKSGSKSDGGKKFKMNYAVINVDGRLQPVVTLESLINANKNCALYLQDKIKAEGEHPEYVACFKIYKGFFNFFVDLKKHVDDQDFS